MPEFLTEFQFLRPWWLCLIPFIILFFVRRVSIQRSAGWAKAISKTNLRHLQTATVSGSVSWLVCVALCVACMALAGPATKTLSGTTGRIEQARVFVLDLSPSMLANDIKPDRLTVARLKLIDMLRLQFDNESALVVYSGTAHRVTPLTNDAKIIEERVPVLHPGIMPVSGSNTEAALDLAVKLITNAGKSQGDIVLITDGIHENAIATIKQKWQPEFRLSILAVGSKEGAPIPVPDANTNSSASYVVDSANAVVLASTDMRALRELALATDGRYSGLTADSSDTDALTSLPPLQNAVSEFEDDQNYDQHHDVGYWLVLLLLPLAVLGFRKHALVCVLPLLVVTPESHAFDWIDLWLSKDQQAQRAMAKGDYVQASQLFTDPRWRFVSFYRQQDYHTSVEQLAKPEYADDLYNRANAQALAGDLEAALVSYQVALQLYTSDAEREDLLHNIGVLRQLMDNEKDTSDETQQGGAGGESQQQGVAQALSTQAIASSEQTQVGGAAGGESTLQQGALQESSSTDNVAGDSDANIADDATVAENDPDTLEFKPDNGDGGDESPVTVENDNPVLTPYSEQWLRELPYDPGGYLRRKFAYQLQVRQQTEGDQSGRGTEIRY